VIRVLIADDHAVVRGGLGQLLATTDDMEIVATAEDGRAAVSAYAQSTPDVVLMDLSMPDVDGIEATRQIVALDPQATVVVLTSFSDDRRIRDALDAGAVGYLLKQASADDLLDAIRAAAAGDSPLDPKAARVMLQAARSRRPAHALSEREEEVLRLVAEGLANKAIARRLDITERTVKAHLTNIFGRLGVTDRTQAALWARDNLRDPP
jgi:DNA-binding NarL/FixJ family response regulator